MRGPGLEKLSGYFSTRYGDRGGVRLSAAARLRGELFRQWAGTGRRLLDVGCGAGSSTQFLLEGNRVVGVDVDAQALEVCRRDYGLRAVWADFSKDLPFESATFDVVVAGETIEHLPYMRLFFDEVRRVLVPGGLFMGSVPNAFRLQNRLRVLRGGPLDREPTHLQHFSLDSLSRAVRDHFELEEIVPVRGKLSRLSPSLFAHYFAWRCRRP